MTSPQFYALLELAMHCGPWPISCPKGHVNINEEIIKDFLNNESKKRGFTDWADAYYNMEWFEK